MQSPVSHCNVIMPRLSVQALLPVQPCPSCPQAVHVPGISGDTLWAQSTAPQASVPSFLGGDVAQGLPVLPASLL